MRLTQPRVRPVPISELTNADRAAIGDFGGRDHLPNLLGTFVVTPDALAALRPWMRHLFVVQTALPPRAREIVSLRIGYLCKCNYQFSQHIRIGLGVGVSAADVAMVKAGADAWSREEAALIRACDEMVADHFISDATWTELSEFFDEQARMYITYTAANFLQICSLLNTFGVQGDPGLELDPELNPAL